MMEQKIMTFSFFDSLLKRFHDFELFRRKIWNQRKFLKINKS